ncbi:MAG: MurR/RpiR family transcriptional regulator [Pseudomonadota bacterium]
MARPSAEPQRAHRPKKDAPKGAAPTSVPALMERVRARYSGLPTRLRQCADLVLTAPRKVAVSTVAAFAEEARVQPSAVIRFCRELGYPGFSSMQRVLRDDYAQDWPDYADRLSALADGGDGEPAALLAAFAEAGRDSIANLTRSLDAKALGAAVETLEAARTIHIAGFRRAHTVATNLAYMFEKMDIPSVLHTNHALVERRAILVPGDAFLAVSFAPYMPEVVALADEARARGLRCVAITDDERGPLGSADVVLRVVDVDVGAFRTLAAAQTLTLTLAVAVGSARKRKRLQFSGVE